MKYLIALVLVLPGAALAQSYNFTLEQRREMHERECRNNAPQAWKVGEAAREAWLASCRREAP